MKDVAFGRMIDEREIEFSFVHRGINSGDSNEYAAEFYKNTPESRRGLQSLATGRRPTSASRLIIFISYLYKITHLR